MKKEEPLLKIKGRGPEGKKIPTIKFFVDTTRITGEEYRGESFYPLYMRITFLRRGTMLKVLNEEGKNLFLTSGDIEKWNKNTNSYLYSYMTGKSLMVVDLIDKEYSIYKERFNFREFTKKFKVLEKHLFYIFNQLLIDKMKELTISRIKEFYLFNEIKFALVLRNQRETTKWLRLVTEKESLPDDFILFAKTMIAYHYYECWVNQKSVETWGSKIGSGTIYHWLFSIDRHTFVTSASEAISDSYQQVDESAFFSKKALEVFNPLSEEYADYQGLINKVINVYTEGI